MVLMTAFLVNRSVEHNTNGSSMVQACAIIYPISLWSRKGTQSCMHSVLIYTCTCPLSINLLCIEQWNPAAGGEQSIVLVVCWNCRFEIIRKTNVQRRHEGLHHSADTEVYRQTEAIGWGFKLRVCQSEVLNRWSVMSFLGQGSRIGSRSNERGNNY